MANPNVFQQLIQPIRSVVDYGADLDRQEMGRIALEGGRRQNALAALTEQQTRAQIEDGLARRNALQRVYSSLPANADPITRARALQADPLTAEQGIAAEKGVIENDKGRASAAKDQAEADAKRAEARYKAADRHAQNLSFVQTPQDIVAYIDEGIQMGLMPPESRQRAVEKAIQMGVPAWKQAAAQGAVAVLDQFKIDAENKRAQLAADTSIANNKRTVGASLANAAATREAAKLQADATRAAANTKRDQDTEMKLADDYRAQSKGFKEAKDAYAQLSATLGSAATSPAATLAAATKFMKILDPGSVVRESELGMALAASGVIDRALNYISTLQSGQKLTPAQVADFKKTSQQIYEAAQSVQRDIDKDYQTKAKTYGLRPEMVTQDLGQNAKVVSWGDLK